MKKNLSIIPAFVILILAVATLGLIAKAQVPASNTLGVWAWSSNIGWIDFRDVNVNQANGLLTGYGWSPNIGWVKFHGLSDYPTTGAPGEPARIDFATGKVYGWVRACAGTVGGETPGYGANCSSMNSRTDGWDGWIELSDAIHSPSRLKYDGATGKVTGMAWGGPVIGWLQFGAVIVPKAFTGSCTGSSDSNGNITFVASASGGSENFLYDWDEADEFSTVNTFFSPYNASSLTRTVALVIEDTVSGQKISPVCPTITRKKDTITGNCSLNGTAYNPGVTTQLFVGDSATFSVSNISGGTGGPFTYKLSAGNGLENMNNPHTKIFNNEVNTDTSIQVTDSSGTVTSNLMCGRISVIDRYISLKIGPNTTSANQSSYRTRMGLPFALKWDNSLLPKYSAVYISPSQNPDGYSCEKIIPVGVNANWNIVWNDDVTSSGVAGNMNTPDAGRYTFMIKCTSNKYPQKDSSAELRVFDPSAGEI